MSAAGKPRLRALTIGVGEFGGAPEGPGDRGLPFAPVRADEVAGALDAYGYARLTLEPGTDLSGDTIAELIRGACEGLTADDLLIVHVVSHGYLNAGGALCILGPDGVEAGFNNVDALLQRVDSDPRLPRTLFLLDLCDAGTVTRAPWQLTALRNRRAWVIAACDANARAFAGRFSRAVAGVLEMLRTGTVDIGPATPFIPLRTLAREVRRAVAELAARENGLPQEVTASLVDLADDEVELPFFRNPRFSPAPIVQARPQVDSGIEPFLADVDEALDAQHFMTRASGYGGAAAGCFSGRDDELQILSDWFDGYDPARLRVVTGGPGAGKSALVGVLVCAAHPVLSPATRPVWRHVQRVPRVHKRFAAVHARHRTTADVIASVTAQLGSPADKPLMEALAAGTGEPPLVVIDALDEAEQPSSLVTELLLPLATTDRADGRPLCRLLVAMRPWEQFAELLGEAQSAGSLIDLDDVPVERLARELDLYVARLLYAFPPYGKLAYAAVRATFAQGVAETLAEAVPRPPGAFLVAGMYAHHLVTAYKPVEDSGKAWEIARKVPRTLEDLLELDLAERAGIRWLRPVLAALAHARGEGMPASVVGAVAGALVAGPTLPGPTRDEINDVLTSAGRFYLRQATDVDGTSLYRLFHQGLADYLRLQPGPGVPDAKNTPAHVLRAMLGHVDPGGWGVRRWELAEPYLLRHVVAHAQEAGVLDELLEDAEFLVAADPVQLAGAGVEWLRGVAEVGAAGDDRRTDLAILASVAGRADLADRLSRRPDGSGVPWSPTWSARRCDADGNVLPVCFVDLGEDGAVGVAYVGGEVEVRSVASGETHTTVSTGVTPYHIGLGVLAGRRVVITGHDEAVLWDAGDGCRLASAPVRASDHELGRLSAGWGVRLSRTFAPRNRSARAVVHGRLVEVAPTPDGIRFVDEPLRDGPDHVQCATVEGISYAVRYSFDRSSTVTIWNLETGALVKTLRFPAGFLAVFFSPEGNLVVMLPRAVVCLRAEPPSVRVRTRTGPPQREARPVPAVVDATNDIDDTIDVIFEQFATDDTVKRFLGPDPLPVETPAGQWRSLHLGLLRLPAEEAATWRTLLHECYPPEWNVPDGTWRRVPAAESEPVILLPAFHGIPGVVAGQDAPLDATVEEALGPCVLDELGVAISASKLLWLVAEDNRVRYVRDNVPVLVSGIREDVVDAVRTALSAYAAGDADRGIKRLVAAADLAEVLLALLHRPVAAPDSWWGRVRTDVMAFVRDVGVRHEPNFVVDDMPFSTLYRQLNHGETAHDVGVTPVHPDEAGRILARLRPGLRKGGQAYRRGRVLYALGVSATSRPAG
ncbi:ATP-binding protein [Actinoplanes sp. DH11]|uniref:ATP-binding protein n=1 Tax=Actinoplanes sp. DH11 TaxID=2857011 RepID=UPI001E4497A9|nr:ATP-binding protein [Actinoplanes sp. DH11]